MTRDYESGKQALQELIAWAGDHSDHSDTTRNEASTRFHLIDRVVEEVLGWEKSAIAVERHHEGTYSDYELGSAAKYLLLEAKREGHHFTLPSGWSKPTIKISDLSTIAPDAKVAIEQAARYCQNRGIPFGAVSTGTQLVAFIASRQDGVPPLDGRALVFRSLQDMLERFNELWSCLSPRGITDNNLATILKADVLQPPPEKLAQRLPDYPGHKNRNPIATELRILGDLFLEDIIRHPEVETSFLEKSYCTSGALSQYALVSKELLQARYATIFEKEIEAKTEPVANRKGISASLAQDIVAAGLSRRPILLVGDVGAGKTMFIRHLIKVQAREELEKAIVLYIDLGTKPALLNELRPFLMGEIERQLLDEFQIDIRERQFVRGVYHGDLLRFARGIYSDLKESDLAAYRIKEIEYLATLTGDQEPHLKRCLEHISRGHKRQIVAFLDNVDQRSADFQEQAFLVAQGLAEHWPITAFIALRPETFKDSKASGSLSAYQPKVFTIEPPRVDLVIARRLSFAKELLEQQGRLPWFPSGFTVHSTSLLNYMSMLHDAFATNDAIVEFVDNMSGGNVRMALDFVGTFIGSAHVDSAKILKIIEDGGRYRLPLHEFLRAVLFGDAVHYHPNKSALVNLLDVSTNDPREHFLLPLIVTYVERTGQLGSTDGYVSRLDVFGFGQRLGYHPRQIGSAIERATRTNLLATPTRSLELAERLRVTPVGAYSVRRLLRYFTYLDAVSVDVPITEARQRDALADARTIQERMARVEGFLEYLSACWAKFEKAPTEILDWHAIEAAVRSELRMIEERLQRRQLHN